MRLMRGELVRMNENFGAPESTGSKVASVLMVIAVVAVAVSAVNLFMSFGALSSVGHVPVDTGQADVEIQSAINVRFNLATLDWGAGWVNGTTNAILQSQTAPYYNGDWFPDALDNPSTTGMSGGLELENWGNVPVNISLNSTADTSAFICNGDSTCDGNSPAFEWELSGLDAADNVVCTGVVIPLQDTAWTTVTSGPGDGKNVCEAFESDPANNEILIDFRLTIPLTAPPGERTTTITATASQS